MTESGKFAVLFLVVAAALSTIDCQYDTSGIPLPTGTAFGGCFQGPDWGGVTLRIQHDGNDGLTAVLAVGLIPNEDVYALSGRANTNHEAVLVGANNDGDQITVDLQLAVNNPDVLTLIIRGGPTTTLNRC